jgi:CheY-like chemotaxis protein
MGVSDLDVPKRCPGRGITMDGPHVLIADDEAPITSILRSRLQRAGFVVSVAADGFEALELARAQPPQIVVTDLQMPRCNGFEFAQAMKQDPLLCDVPVLLLTACGYIIEDADRESTNIVAVMAKPFSANEVVRRVVELLGTAHLSQRKESA